MARILNDLDLVARKLDGDKWQLIDDLYYHVGGPDSTEVIIVNKGFITDGASTPWGVRNLWPKDGTYTPCAAVHDLLYRYQGILPIDNFTGPYMTYSRKRCDRIFIEAMKVKGVGWFTRQSFYTALRLGGWFSWNKKENQPGRKQS